jgi:hypothetical protein
MFKTHFQAQDKELIIASIIMVGLLLMFVIDVMVIFPNFLKIYNTKIVQSKNPIDAQAVNDAIKQINQ